MIGSLGFTEVAFILILALLIFGPKRLPEMGRMLGKGMGEFRRASNELKRTFNAEISLAEEESRESSRPELPTRREPKETVAREPLGPSVVTESASAEQEAVTTADESSPDSDSSTSVDSSKVESS